MHATAERVKDSLKYLVVSGVFFEEMGFKYLGPIDGHDFEALEETLICEENERASPRSCYYEKR